MEAKLLQIVVKVFFVHQPVVIEDVFGAEPQFWVRLEHVVDQITNRLTDSILK